mmetsp:Transcript_6239/g.12393  ORF Transcript_6239/g.12393 Transcript_6239/m.12393 type:complete len:915 (+) Transcript_6239:47-2791(+)
MERSIRELRESDNFIGSMSMGRRPWKGVVEKSPEELTKDMSETVMDLLIRIFIVSDIGYSVFIIMFLTHSEWNRVSNMLLVCACGVLAIALFATYRIKMGLPALADTHVILQILVNFVVLFLLRTYAVKYCAKDSHRLLIEELITILLLIRGSGVLLYTPFARLPNTSILFVIVALHANLSPILDIFLPAGLPRTLPESIGRLVFNLVLASMCVQINTLIAQKWMKIFVEQKDFRDKMRRRDERTHEAAARARAMIQHGMKNVCASMSASCEIAIQDDQADVPGLKDELRRLMGLASMGVILCNKRAKMAMVEDEKFKPESVKVNCTKLILSVVHLSPRIKVDIPTQAAAYAMGDEDIIYFVLENALTNAVHHGVANTPIEISLVMNQSRGEVIIRVANTVSDRFRLRHGFKIEDGVEAPQLANRYQTPSFDQSFTIMEEKGSSRSHSKFNSPFSRARDLSVAQLRGKGAETGRSIDSRMSFSGVRTKRFALKGTFINNRADCSPRTAEHCIESSYKGESGKSRKKLSEGLGLRIIKTCCRKAFYCCSFFQEENKVVLQLNLPIAPRDAVSNRGSRISILCSSGKDLTELSKRMIYKDTSQTCSVMNVERPRILTPKAGDEKKLFQQSQEPSSAAAQSSKEGAGVTAASSNVLAPSSRQKSRDDDGKKAAKTLLKICCVEDERLIRKMYQRVLLRKFSKDSIILGESVKEVKGATSRIMAANCDAVILDQNLVYSDAHILGTDLCKDLRAKGFLGVILMRSANTEKSDVDIYLGAGADGYLPKSYTSSQIAREIEAAVHERKQELMLARASCSTTEDVRVSAKTSGVTKEQKINAAARVAAYSSNALVSSGPCLAVPSSIGGPGTSSAADSAGVTSSAASNDTVTALVTPSTNKPEGSRSRSRSPSRNEMRIGV